jgi:hypothetical protein
VLRYTKYRLRIGEAWFDELLDRSGLDVMFLTQYATPPPNAACAEKRTILINLSRDEETLFGDMKRDARYNIRRARDTDKIRCDCLAATDLEVQRDFCKLYDQFAADKGLHAVDPARLALMARHGVLDFSRAVAADGKVLAMHAYLVLRARARLLYSLSLFRSADETARRQMIGRANRYLHWHDLCRFKAAGLQLLDMGGWYAGQSDQGRIRINHFKEEFGGQIVTEYNGTLGLTLRGKLALLVWNRLHKTS